jgi:hypothetical protein
MRSVRKNDNRQTLQVSRQRLGKRAGFCVELDVDPLVWNAVAREKIFRRE